MQDRVGFANEFYEHAIAASRRELMFVRDCDYHFRLERNDKIYSKSPLWAFNGDSSFPSPEGGIRLVQE